MRSSRKNISNLTGNFIKIKKKKTYKNPIYVYSMWIEIEAQLRGDELWKLISLEWLTVRNSPL